MENKKKILLKKPALYPLLILALTLTLCTGVLSAFAETVTNGWSGDNYYKNGKKVTGLATISGKKYIFSKKGTLVKDRFVYRIKAGDGYQYFNISSKGTAKRWTGTAEKAAGLVAALNKNKNTISTSNRETYLKKAFYWSSTKIRYYNNENPSLSGSAAAKYYGDAAFDERRGDCDTQAYAVYWMAKVLGYTPKYMRGYILTVNGLKDYAWCEVKMGKTTYVFDPNFNSSSQNGVPNRKTYGKYCGYKFRYGDHNTYSYYNKKKKKLKR